MKLHFFLKFYSNTQAGRGMLSSPKRFELLKSNYFIKHRENVKSGVTNPAPLGSTCHPAGLVFCHNDVRLI